MQSPKQSAIETLTNTGIGIIGSWLISYATICMVQDRLAASTITVAGCTVWSLIRGYTVRRVFNNRQSKQR